MRFLLSFIVAFFIAVNVYGQTSPANDTTYAVQLKEVKVVAPWKNDTERYHYNQMKYYVTTILPYLNVATTLFKEVSNKLDEPGLTRHERKEFLNAKDDEMRERFEDKIKELNVTQGVLLVKLIARQTDMNICQMLVDFRNPIVAIKWQAWARLHGLNLDKKYHPEDEPYLERIMDELGYPLPADYAMSNH